METNFERMLVEHCAPALCGLKAANLFRISGVKRSEVHCWVNQWDAMLRPCGISMQIVKECGNDSFLVYVWRHRWLSHLLNGAKTGAFLRSQGYRTDCGAEAMIDQLSARLAGSETFPHEIGVFLGYPLMDVIGFIRYGGKNYTCSGYWKSYCGNAERARKGFEAYKNCFRNALEAFDHGTGVMQMVTAA